VKSRRRDLRLRVALVAERRRLVAGVVFAAVALLACVLLARRLTDSSWPFAHARMLLVGVAAVCYFVAGGAKRRRRPLMAAASTNRAGEAHGPRHVHVADRTRDSATEGDQR
jgi:hypothetical protein